MSDLINRQDAIDAMEQAKEQYFDRRVIIGKMQDIVNNLPSAEPEVKPISYTDCANAMLMMWMDEVLTDGEYNRIMDKLNAYEMKKREENG